MPETQDPQYGRTPSPADTTNPERSPEQAEQDATLRRLRDQVLHLIGAPPAAPATASPFHCFLCHNSSDKPRVRQLARALAERGLRCWLDEEQLRPGLPWQPLLEQGIRDSAAVAVCIAADGIGPWQDAEMQAALQLAVRTPTQPVMAVLLPGAPDRPTLPAFLAIRGWVDLRAGVAAEGLDRLIWGITGQGPAAPAPPGASPSERPPMSLQRLPEHRHGLLPIAGGTDRDLDLILVHGLGGDAFTTWMADPDRLDTFWPNWLAADRPRLGLWTLGYAADASGWKSESMALADRGTQVLDLLETEGIGERPLVFVTHSLGGIVAKQLLRHAVSFGVPRWRKIGEQTRGIAFIATPHSGANIASFAEFASAVFRTNEQVKELAAHDARLRELHGWFRGFYTEHGLNCRTWCERREVRPELPLLGLRLPKGILVVDATSAEPNLPGEVAIPLDEDHLSICKPVSRDAQLYRSLLRWVDACVHAPTAGQGAATPATGPTARSGVAPALQPAHRDASGAPAPAAGAAPAPPQPGAVAIWRERLEYLRVQEAICSDPAQRFTLKKQIEEAEARLRGAS